MILFFLCLSKKNGMPTTLSRHNQSLAQLFRIFHALLWFVVFLGILCSRNPRIVFICVFIMILGIMLWDVLGDCFVSILENSFSSIEPIHESFDTFDYLSQKTNIPAYIFGHCFTLSIYLIFFIGMFRVYFFLRHKRIAT